MLYDEMKPIIFYDIPSITPSHPWSPNTMKTRYCLGYKQLPFTTVWIELPDIIGLLQSKGITQPPYTLPAIEDPNTGAFIVDSFAIASYLDDRYPDTPPVLNPAVHAALEGIGDVFSFGTAKLAKALADAGPNGTGTTANAASQLVPRLVFLILASERLNPVSKAYYHQTRASWIGEAWTTLAEACGTSPERREERVQQGIEAIGGVCRKVTTTLYGGTSRFALGEEPSFVDFAVAGRIKFVLDSLTTAQVGALANLDGGRLVRLAEDLERYL